MPEVLYVRLKPRNPRAGIFCKRFDYRDPQSGRFYPFTTSGKWYIVPKHVGEALRDVEQDPYTPVDTPLLFDVCTEEEARRFDSVAKREREEAKRKKDTTVDSAVDMADEVGRGDLSLDDLGSRRAAALEDVGKPEPKPKAKAKRKPVVRTKPKPKAKAKSKPATKTSAAKRPKSKRR